MSSFRIVVSMYKCSKPSDSEISSAPDGRPDASLRTAKYSCRSARPRARRSEARELVARLELPQVLNVRVHGVAARRARADPADPQPGVVDGSRLDLDQVERALLAFALEDVGDGRDRNVSELLHVASHVALEEINVTAGARITVRREHRDIARTRTSVSFGMSFIRETVPLHAR